MVSLYSLDLLYASLQLPLDNRENKNSRNVCLSQIRENIFPRKFLLIQYQIWPWKKIDLKYLIPGAQTALEIFGLFWPLPDNDTKSMNIDLPLWALSK